MAMIVAGFVRFLSAPNFLVHLPSFLGSVSFSLRPTKSHNEADIDLCPRRLLEGSVVWCD